MSHAPQDLPLDGIIIVDGRYILTYNADPATISVNDDVPGGGGSFDGATASLEYSVNGGQTWRPVDPFTTFVAAGEANFVHGFKDLSLNVTGGGGSLKIEAGVRPWSV